MMKKHLLIFSMVSFLCASLAGCYGSSGKKEDPVEDECGDIKAAIFPIINGVMEPDPDVVELTPSQIAAVGGILLSTSTWRGNCTATLIAPNAVLTAAHCVDSLDVFSIDFSVGQDVSFYNRDAAFATTEWNIHPAYPGYVSEYDIAVLILYGDPLAEGIMPIPVNCEPTSLVGETIQAVGYGLTYPSQLINTRRYWTTLPVTDETDGVYFPTSDESGPCFGDSGSPMLYTKSDGKVYVMGVDSGGEPREDCLGYSVYPRTDFSCDFIREFLPADPCWDETLQGRCEQDIAIWCEDETVHVEDCELSGMVCEQDEGSGNHRCQDAPDPCEGETYEGRCDANTAIWCEAETIIRKPCEEGELCGDAGDGLRRCVDECELIGREGRCDENGAARWCEDGGIRERDCAACDQECGWVDETMGFYCI